MVKKIYSFILISSVLFASENNNVSEQKLTQSLDNYMQVLTDLNRFSGTVLVAKGDHILLNKGYGLASHEFNIANTIDTTFRICSITKMVTAATIMQLQEKGQLNVSDTLNKYIPDYPRGDEITIHQLLTHTAGLSSCNMPLEMVVMPITIDQIISFYKTMPLEFEPGTGYQYSNAGYFILSDIIQKISGVSYEEYVTKNILKPSNMNQSFFRDHNYAILRNCATGYCVDQENSLVNGHYVYENFTGSGGLFCTTQDLYQFVFALSKGLLINEKSLNEMCTSYHPQENYGYGCEINKIQNHACIEHGGMLSSGFKTNVSLFKDDQVYIVILSNFFSAWVNDARNALAAIMFDEPYQLPSHIPIIIDSALYDDYVGLYDHPEYPSSYKIEKKDNKLYLPNGTELFPVASDQWMSVEPKAKNLLYSFVRNEHNQITQLRIKGGGPYFEVRCEKLS